MYDAMRKYMEAIVHFSDDEWQAFADTLKIRKVKKKQPFIREGATPREIGYLYQGSMRYYYTKDGEEITTFLFFENSMVTVYNSFLKRTPSAATVEAMQDCELIDFDYDTLQSLYEKYPVFQKFGRLIAEWLYCCVEERMSSLLLDKPEIAYKKLLEQDTGILNKIPQRYIASYLGITPVSLSRIRKRIAGKVHTPLKLAYKKIG